MMYLHGLPDKVIHRDCKSKNVLIELVPLCVTHRPGGFIWFCSATAPARPHTHTHTHTHTGIRPRGGKDPNSEVV